MYKWVIAGTGFLVLGVAWGTAQTGFGAFVPILTADPLDGGMGWSRTAVSAAFSINVMTTFNRRCLLGWLSDRWSVRGVIAITGSLMGAGFFFAGSSNALWQLYLFYGLIAGVGLGGTVGPLTAMVPRWFPQNPGMIIGIMYAGFGAASAVIPILAERLISIDGWRLGFQGLGFLIWGIFLVGVILLREPRPRKGSLLAEAQQTNPDSNNAPNAGRSPSSATAPALPSDRSSIGLSSALRTRQFWTLFSMMLGGSLIVMMVFVHLVPRAVDIGTPTSTAVTLLTVFGLVNLVSAPSGGFLGDRFGARKMYLAALLLYIFALLWLTLSSSLWMLYVFAVAFAIGNGVWSPQIPMIAAGIFGTRHMGSIFAAILVAAGFGGVLGPIIAGYVFDTLGSYRFAFLLATGVAVVGALLIFVLKDRPSTTRPPGP